MWPNLIVWLNLCLDQYILGKHAFVPAYFCPLFDPQSTSSVNQPSDRQDMMAHWEFYKMGILLWCHLKISLHSMTQSRLHRALTVQLRNLGIKFHTRRLIKELSHIVTYVTPCKYSILFINLIRQKNVSLPELVSLGKKNKICF